MKQKDGMMQTALRITTYVLPRHRIEITAPELAEGAAVEMFVVMPEAATIVKGEQAVPAQPLMDFLDALPPGPRSAPNWEEMEHTLQEERAVWDR